MRMIRDVKRAWRSLKRNFAPKVGRHRLISEKVHQGLHILQIAKEEPLTVVIDERGATGYHGYGNDWWLQARCPYSFKYLSIDTMYPAEYFHGHGHPQDQAAHDLVDYMQNVFRALFSRDLGSVLELGSGGGEITKVFADRNLDFVTVEGTDAGVRRLREIGVGPDRILQHNLKFMPRLERRFDLVMCTEVAEHIEPFFASKVVQNCVDHGDAVWFSAADRHRAAHYHHINELPIEAWDNLFAHMGFPYFVELDQRHGRASRVYLRNDVG